MSKAVIIYGPPGAGKGTQADLLVRKFGFIHFDTGRYLEGLFRDVVAVKSSKILQKEKKNFDEGDLCTPTWVLKIVSDATKKIVRSGFSIVYSGSPRTLFEAFGDPPALTSSRRSRAGKENKGLMQVLYELYGKKNITVIKLEVRPWYSLKRNSERYICSVCGLPRLAGVKTTRCVFCAGQLRRRILDDPKIIKERLEEYKRRTYPVILEMKKKGYCIKKINGEPLPYKVSENIVRVLGLGRGRG